MNTLTPLQCRSFRLNSIGLLLIAGLAPTALAVAAGFRGHPLSPITGTVSVVLALVALGWTRLAEEDIHAFPELINRRVIGASGWFLMLAVILGIAVLTAVEH